MKCKFCGSPRAKYKVSRKKFWKGRSAKGFGHSSEPRKDFTVYCPDCKKEYVES